MFYRILAAAFADTKQRVVPPTLHSPVQESSSAFSLGVTVKENLHARADTQLILELVGFDRDLFRTYSGYNLLLPDPGKHFLANNMHHPLDVPPRIIAVTWGNLLIDLKHMSFCTCPKHARLHVTDTVEVTKTHPKNKKLTKSSQLQWRKLLR